jgi:hypothetical protein
LSPLCNYGVSPNLDIQLMTRSYTRLVKIFTVVWGRVPVRVGFLEAYILGSSIQQTVERLAAEAVAELNITCPTALDGLPPEAKFHVRIEFTTHSGYRITLQETGINNYPMPRRCRRSSPSIPTGVPVPVVVLISTTSTRSTPCRTHCANLLPE